MMNSLANVETKKELKGSQLSILIAGVSWPPPSFLTRLIYGLLDANIRITVASEAKPEEGDRKNTTLDWIHTPAWSGPPLQLLSRLAWMKVKALVGAYSDVLIFSPYARMETSWVRRQHQWHRLLPFAGRRWDAIYFPWNSSAIIYYPLFDLGIPVILSCRGSQINSAPHNPKRKGFQQMLRKTFRRATVVHCVSETIRDEARKYGLPSNKAVVIHPGVPCDFFKPSERRIQNQEYLHIVSTGAFAWPKGLEHSLVAIRYLKDKGVPVRFHMIGDGPEMQRVLFTIHDLRIQENVILHGHLNQEEVRNVLQQSDLFLFSSLSEGLPNAVLEAMACALPVVTTDCGGTREAVRDGMDGMIVPLMDSEALASAALRLYQDPELRRKMGEAGRNQVLEKFSITRQVSKFLEIVQNVACHSKSSEGEASLS